MKVASRSRKGQGLMEAAAAAMFLIPIAMGLLNVTVMVISNMTNDTAAKNCARAAANQNSQPQAQQAAQKIINGIKTSSIITSVALSSVDYPASKEAVTVTTTMDVRLPVPFPGFDHQVFVAKAVEPILAM